MQLEILFEFYSYSNTIVENYIQKSFFPRILIVLVRYYVVVLIAVGRENFLVSSNIETL